jgi:ribosomal protein S18 acetylase RimI-like enzyme
MYNVRLARIEDIEEISSVLAMSWKTAYRGIVGDDYLDSLRYDHWVEFLSNGLISNTVFPMVLLDGNKIIGASILGKSENEDKAHMISLYLLPERTGQGIGSMFYHEIENEMKKRGFAKCALDVLKNNMNAIRFYEKNGFMDTRTEITATFGGQGYACKVYEKLLK